MKNCNYCGQLFDGHGYKCQACRHIETIKKEHENNRRHAEQLVAKQKWDSEHQARLSQHQREVEQRQLQEQINAQQVNINLQLEIKALEEQKLEELRRVTKILEEQMLSDSFAHEEGFALKLKTTISEIDSPNFHIYHHIEFGLTQDGEIYIRSINPGFESTRLKAGFHQGVTDRINKDFKNKIDIDTLCLATRQAGKTCNAIEHINSDGEFYISITVDITKDGYDKLLAVSDAIKVRCELYTNPTTGEIKYTNLDLSEFQATNIATAFQLGFNDYISNLNADKDFTKRQDLNLQQSKPQSIEARPLTATDPIQAYINANIKSKEDPLYDQALHLVLTENMPSPSFIQRKLRINYNRAIELINIMEVKGIVSTADERGQRQILFSKK